MLGWFLDGGVSSVRLVVFIYVGYFIMPQRGTKCPDVAFEEDNTGGAFVFFATFLFDL